MILYHKKAAFFPKGKEISPASKTSRFAPGKQLLNEKYRTIVLGMKLVGFFMLIACLHAGAKGFSQTVTLAGKDLPLRQVFDRIEDQTGYGIFIDKTTLAESKPVTLNVKDATIELVMKACLKEQPFPLTFTITGHTINVIRAGADDLHQPALDAVPAGTPQSIILEFKGRVTNEAGEPLQGATIEVQRAKTGTFTDEHGMFTLKNISSDAVLEISFTGYQKTTVKLAGSGNQVIVLKVATSSLDKVQIIAYGTTTKRLNTGDISTINSDEIEQQPVTNPLLALEGRVPGLFITQSTGLPGTGVSVLVQGQNSIANGNDPFYVIDGVPYSSELLSNFGSILGSSGINNQSNGNPLSYLNPGDIESISVLKDADATAIYGSRAANGAILITTKKGKSGQTKVDINLQNGWGQVTRKLDLLNTAQYLQMRHEAISNDGLTTQSTDYDINGTWDTTRYTDWQKSLIGGTAQYTNLSATVSGGNANTQYLVGATYNRATTVFPDAFADQKGSVHFNINTVSPNQKFRLQLTGNYLVDNNQLPSGDLTGYGITLAPDAPSLYNKDGSLNWMPTASGTSTWTNPVALLYNTYSNKANNLVSNAVLSYQVISALDLKCSFGYTNLQTNETVVYPSVAVAPEDRAYEPRYADYGNNNINTWIAEPQATYKLFVGKGKLEALVGTTFQQTNSNGYSLLGLGFNSDLVMHDINSAATIIPAGSVASIYKYNALFGRLSYNWEDKYLLNMTIRRDGSSRFGSANQFHDFEAVGIAWVFSKEAFVQKNLGFISFGKFRASYGTTGNDQIGDYKYLSLYTPTGYQVPYQNVTTLSPNGLSNPYLQWEETKKLDFGMDLGILKDRVLLNVNYFENRSSNQLLPYSLPLLTGFNQITENFPATVQNTGWEFSLKTTNVKTKTFNWSTSINLTLPQNRLIAFPNLATSSYASLLVVGKPITIVKEFHYLGVNDTTGVFQFASKGGPTSNPIYGTDNTVIINTSPSYYGGFQNSFAYRGLELDILFQFVKQKAQNYLFGNIPGYFSGQGNVGNQPQTVLNRWQKPGDIKPIQQYNSDLSLYTPFSDAASYSDAAWADASYVRLKNMSLSWQIPVGWGNKMHIKYWKIYALGQNLLTFTHYKGLDPETRSSTTLPPLKVITLGLQVGL
jgi:TonB-linked SusC/RagA family outer membrane protein